MKRLQILIIAFLILLVFAFESTQVKAALTVSVLPAGPLTMDVGQTQFFTVAASDGNGTLSYQWYLDSTLVSGQTASTYTYTAAVSASHTIYVRVTDSSIPPVTVQSNAVSVTVNSALVAPTVSASLGTVSQGQTSSLTSSSVTTGTSPYAYQWLSRAPGVGSYSAISGATSSSYSFVTSGSTTTGAWSFELRVTDAVSSVVTSSAVSVTVNSALVAPTVSASLGTVSQGQTSSLTSSSVTTGTSPYAYQWLSRAPGVGSYSAISGATSSSYSFVTSGSTTTGAWSFELRVTDAVSSVVTSSAVSVTVNSALVAPTVSASLGTVSQGQTSSLTSSSVTTGTSPYAYQWLSRAPGVGSYSAISGATSSSYSFVTSGSTTTGVWSFELRVTDAVSSVVTSSAVSVTVNSALVAPTVSASLGTVSQGQTSSLTSSSVTTGTSPYAYQWLSRAPGVGSYSAISGATSSSYSFVTSGSTTTGVWSFELRVTDAVSSVVTSSAVSVTVNSALVAPTVSASLGTVSQGQTSSLTSSSVTTGTSPYAYQWLSRAPGVGSYSAISGATSSSYSFVTSGSTTTGVWSFELRVTDAVSSVVTSSAVSVTVNSALVAPTVSASLGTVSQGQTSSLTSSSVTTGTSPYAYQWLSRAPGVGSYSAISGATSSSYSFVTSITTATGSWSFLLQVSDNAGVAVNSSAVSVTVNIPPLDHFVFSSIGTKTAGTSFSITITAKDASNNTLTNFVGTNTLNVSIGTVNPPSTGVFSSGVWTGSITLTGAGSGVTLFTTGSGMSGISNSFTVNSGTLNSFTFDTIISPQTVGSAFTITVMAKDIYGNTVTSYASTPSLTYSAGAINPGSMNAFVNGVGSASVTVTGAGSDATITATEGTHSGFSNSFTVTLAPTPSPTPDPTTNPTSTPMPTSLPTAKPTPTTNPSTSPTSTAAPSPALTPTVTVIATTDTGAKINLVISGNIALFKMSTVTIITNQSAMTTTVSFTVNRESGTIGFSNMTIPKTAIPYGTKPVIFVDGPQSTNQGYTQDTNNFYLWCTVPFGTHQVRIQFAVSSLLQDMSFGSVLAVGITVPEIILIYAVIAIRRLKRKPEST